MSVDVLLVNPGNAISAYQGLSHKFSAIEPPTWALLLAQSVRTIGFVPSILDVNAEHLVVEEAVKRIRNCEPRLICLVVYGQNPNSGTMNMIGAVRLAEPDEIFSAYKSAYERIDKVSTLIVEYGDYYNEK